MSGRVVVAEQNRTVRALVPILVIIVLPVGSPPGGKPPGVKRAGRSSAHHKRHAVPAGTGAGAGVAGSAAAAAKAATRGGPGAARGSSSGQEGEIKAHREDDDASSTSASALGDGAEAGSSEASSPPIQLRRQYTDQGDGMALPVPSSKGGRHGAPAPLHWFGRCASKRGPQLRQAPGCEFLEAGWGRGCVATSACLIFRRSPVAPPLQSSPSASL